MKKISSKSRPIYDVVKRSMDLLVSVVFIILFLPVYGLIALLIFIDDGCPVLFKQKRTGHQHKDFVIYKFRSMKCHERVIVQHKWKDGVPADFGKNEASTKMYLTKVGRFLRQWSLDELPQFFNVLNGTMSLVGPRPELPEITAQYNPEQAQRLIVKPGITGLAQVSGRSELSHHDKIQCDLYYCAHYGLFMDLNILLRTFVKVFSRRGAV
jgi:lipopolysaccharide/colanic/teichoic acid biosynthesis glycosyltransferase